MPEWLILVLLVPAIVVPVVMLIGFVGCNFVPGAAPFFIIIDSAVGASPSSILLTWESPGYQPTSFDILRTDSSGGWTFLQGAASASPFLDTGLDPGSSYIYRVRGFLSGDPNPSDWSSPVTGTTLPSPIGAPVFLGSATMVSGFASVSANTTSTAPSGSVIVVATMCSNTNVTSVTDGANTYTKINEITNAGTSVGLWYTATTLASQLPAGTTVTVNFSGFPLSEAAMAMCSITGLVNNASDIFANAPTTATPGQSIATGTLAQADEIIIGWLASFDASPSYTPGTGFASITSIASFGLTSQATVNLEYKIVASPNSVTWNPTASNALTANGVIEVASFKGV
jgi:hypothetical protein